jgi:hypothetical protein
MHLRPHAHVHSLEFLRIALTTDIARAHARRAPSIPPCRRSNDGVTMREKIASLRPFPVGVVFQQDPRVHTDVARIRAEFATIKALGFNALKQVMLTNVSIPFIEAVFTAAIEEGLVPWW